MPCQIGSIQRRTKRRDGQNVANFVSAWMQLAVMSSEVGWMRISGKVVLHILSPVWWIC